MKFSIRSSVCNVSLLFALAASGATLVACGSATGGDAEERGGDPVSAQQPLTLHPLGVVRDDPALLSARRVSVSAPGALPAALDLSAQLPPPGDQQNNFSCVGWAVGYAATSYHQAIQEGWSLSPNSHRSSPSWIWNQLNGGVNQGISVGNALSLVVNKGDDDIADFPHVNGDYTSQPSAASFGRAARFKAGSWASLTVSQANFKNVLASGNPVVIAFEVFPDWDALNNSTNTVYDTINANESSRGGHAVAIVGYDDGLQAFKVLNSWGTTTWGANGYDWIAYSFINNTRLAMDAYVLADAPNSLVRNGIDVNLDRANDLVFHNGSTGQTQVWYMNSIIRTSAASLDASLNIADASGWTPVAMADFNNDRNPDIVWHNGSTGASQIWYMNGTARTSYADLSAALNVTDSTGWRFQGAADFNQDGKPELFARNLTSGAMQLWLMDGATRTGYIDLSSSLNTPASTGWNFVGTGDFNQDGSTDILWHNGVSGDSQVWYMNGATRVSAAMLDVSLNVKDSSGWKLSTVTDLNHDGKPDVLAHNGTTGQFQVWFLDNITRTSYANLDAGLNTADSTGWRSLTE